MRDRILVVADHALKQRTLAAAWSGPGGEVIGHAADLPTCLQAIRQLRPTLVVLDPDSQLGRNLHARQLMEHQAPELRFHVGMPPAPGGLTARA